MQQERLTDKVRPDGVHPAAVRRRQGIVQQRGEVIDSLAAGTEGRAFLLDKCLRRGSVSHPCCSVTQAATCSSRFLIDLRAAGEADQSVSFRGRDLIGVRQLVRQFEATQRKGRGRAFSHPHDPGHHQKQRFGFVACFSSR